MAEEIELKLALPEDAQRNFLRHPLLQQAARKQSYRLTNLYYDTPARELRQRGIALRLREHGGFWLQSVKCAGQRAGGISARPEWETPYAGHFDFAAIDDPAVRDWLSRPKLLARIAPVFETNFQRTAWTFELPRGTRVELALDRGWIVANGQRQAISEIEIELLAGEAMQLFVMAQTLAQRIPLAPAPQSKADRGYRLWQQLPAAPVKAAPIPLAASAAPADAFRAIALACLDHLQQNHLGALACDSADPEYIHQMRISTRRLRAALRLFGPQLPDGLAAALLPPLSELMAVLGPARDLDVLLAEIAAPVLTALPDEPRLAALVGIITERRFVARQEAMRFMRSPRYGGIVLQALAILHAQPETVKVGAGGTAISRTAANLGTATSRHAANLGTALPDAALMGATQTLIEFAQNRLRRLRKKVLALAGETRVDNPSSLHALRIDIKRLRYALEFFTPLASPKALRRMLLHLTRLQDALGQINDLASAGELLMSCADDDPRLREAVTLIGGWHGPRHHKLLKAVPAGLKQLGRLRLPKLTAA
ncbi:MAG: CYTH and CHAD domain-containing protein [Rhodocyclaceae bacterium]|nr:CYTH and CHAD domain-containing protein [Rhodocyclaceae bacterium]